MRCQDFCREAMMSNRAVWLRENVRSPLSDHCSAGASTRDRYELPSNQGRSTMKAHAETSLLQNQACVCRTEPGPVQRDFANRKDCIDMLSRKHPSLQNPCPSS